MAQIVYNVITKISLFTLFHTYIIILSNCNNFCNACEYSVYFVNILKILYFVLWRIQRIEMFRMIEWPQWSTDQMIQTVWAFESIELFIHLKRWFILMFKLFIMIEMITLVKRIKWFKQTYPPIFHRFDRLLRFGYSIWSFWFPLVLTVSMLISMITNCLMMFMVRVRKSDR